MNFLAAFLPAPAVTAATADRCVPLCARIHRCCVYVPTSGACYMDEAGWCVLSTDWWMNEVFTIGLDLEGVLSRELLVRWMENFCN